MDYRYNLITYKNTGKMNDWQQIDRGRRINIIETVSKETGLSPASIEKDWRVTMALRALFRCDCAEVAVFKGGTSLSKAWNLIERMSEDVDIAVDRSFFGFEGQINRSAITKLRKASCLYIGTSLKSQLTHHLQDMGITGFSLNIPETGDTAADPQIIELKYETLFAEDGDTYIKEKVLIEIGSRSLIEPSKKVEVRSVIANSYPQSSFADPTTPIPTVIPQRTFLEKAFLLHEEFQKPAENIRVERMSRHLYDLERLMDTGFARNALEDISLYQSIVDHRSKLTAISGIDYSTHSPDTINFVPQESIIERWRNDYSFMQANMIYGESLPFEKLIERIKELNGRFREITVRYFFP
jgi:hypothetical protein